MAKQPIDAEKIKAEIEKGLEGIAKQQAKLAVLQAELDKIQETERGAKQREANENIAYILSEAEALIVKACKIADEAGVSFRFSVAYGGQLITELLRKTRRQSCRN